MNGFQRLAKSAQVFEPCVILKPEKICIGAHSRIDTFTKLEGGQGLDIGEYVHVASFCHLNIGGGRLILEDHCTLSSHVCIASATPDWNYLYVSASEPSEHRHTKRYITRICSYAAIFTGVIVVPGVTVGEGAIVKPGSVVTEDVRPWTIVTGNPAVAIGKRKIQSRDNEPDRSLQLSQFDPIYP
jgi:acetyltransferase-like isoleucine patch superfamily enzyme